MTSPNPALETPPPETPGDRPQQIPIPSGFRLIIFLVLYALGTFSVQSTLSQIPSFRVWASAQNPKFITPVGQIAYVGTELLVLLLTVRIMAVGEKKSFAAYGLPRQKIFGKLFWQGAVLGLAMISVLMACISMLNGFTLGGLASSPAVAIRCGVLYAVGFFLVGLFEEFSFRGYMQATLGGGVGFWAAAVALSILFGAMHIPAEGTGGAGVLMAACFGLLAAFSLQRTGNLWLAIGMHAAFDWGNAFLYSAPLAGLSASQRLVNSTLHGPDWLTGGTAGPQGSVFAFVVLGLAAGCIHFMFPGESRQGMSGDRQY